MSNIGREIIDFYCNGFFGREYDLSGSIIIAEGDEYLVIRKPNGIVDFCNFQQWDYNRNEDGSLSVGIKNLNVLDKKTRQEYIDEWCY